MFILIISLIILLVFAKLLRRFAVFLVRDSSEAVHARRSREQNVGKATFRKKNR